MTETKWCLIKLHQLTEDEERLEQFLKDRTLLLLDPRYSKCNNVMKRQGSFYRCRKTTLINRHKVQCDSRVSIHRGTWFFNSNLSEGIILKMTYCLVKNWEQVTIANEVGVSITHVNQWAKYARDVMEEWSLQASEVIGGEGKVVEIDESKFGKRKYNKGKRVEGTWVFGGVERGSGKIFMVPVPTRDRNTLLPVIKEWIRPGSTIMSDCWKAYGTLQDEEYQHLTVNHDLHFVDPDSGAHTNTVEGAWAHAKYFMPRFGRRKQNLSGYLAHHMFTKRARSEKRDIFEYFLEIVGQLQFDVGVNHYASSGESDSDCSDRDS